jgi:hypothetical protein
MTKSQKRYKIPSQIRKFQTNANKSGWCKGQLYITVDFECVNQHGGWCAFGILVARYPCGEVLHSSEVFCHRSSTEYDLETTKFWKQHTDAFQYIKEGWVPQRSEVESEKLLIKHVQGVFLDYGDAYFVSDNPQFDIRLLDNILQKHGHPTVAKRIEGRYLPTLCTRSFKLGVFALNHRSNTHKPKMGARSVDAKLGPFHTPIADCMRIISQHFALKDLISPL